MQKRYYILKRFLIIIFLGLLSLQLHANANQERKTAKAVRTSTPPVINGCLEDEVWQKAEPVTNFYQYEPHNDRPASHETYVKILYDDNSIYIGAKMLDPNPDSILTELGLRNSGDDLNADRFWININPFDDGINGFTFQVTASGVQTDINLAGSGSSRGFGGGRGDMDWDAVWESDVSITDEGWIAEMEIPYSALRFPRNDIHEWGINFWREIRRERETSSWNFVDRSVGDPLRYMGKLENIDDITPPLRLSFYPYTTGYVEKDDVQQEWGSTSNFGMDVKYGISPSFTLDVTLIPDFGQVQTDEKVLDLSPYEVKYDEQRQFFTEGVELFEKADLFYSRRIGDTPRGHRDVLEKKDEHEKVIENPLETQLINASKISGRTSSGLGLGFLNAMTSPAEATLMDTITDEKRKIITQPFTNYNLVVADQSFRNNSFVSLINTNVAGSADGYTANVTGTDFRVFDSSNMYSIRGSGALSQQYFSDADDNFGYKYDLSFGKFGGTWQYNYSRSVINDTYEQDDMGFLRRNNLIDDDVSLSHNIFSPFWVLRTLTNEISVNYSRLYEPDEFTDFSLSYNLRALFDNRFFLMFFSNYQPLGERDYFEPRVWGHFYETDESYDFRLMFSSDYRRRLYVDGNISYGKILSEYNQDEYNFRVEPTFRASDQFNMSYGFNYREQNNDIGFVSHDEDNIYFGKRQPTTITNTFNSTYIFTNELSLSFDLRHYWSRVDYDGNYYLLEEDGRLNPIQEDLQIPDINYNAFNIDMMLTWHFAPGSQLTLMWKNIIDHSRSDITYDYVDNLTHILGEPQINSLSLRVLYYIDYQAIQRLARNNIL